MILYALSAVYFAGVMVRLMLTLTPVVCILSGVAFSGLLELFLREDDTPRNEDSEDEDQSPPNSRRLYDKVTRSCISVSITNFDCRLLLDVCQK